MDMFKCFQQSAGDTGLITTCQGFLGSSSWWRSGCLHQFQGQTVGIGKEDAAATGEGVDADGLGGDAVAVQLGDTLLDVGYREGEVAQALGLGVGGALGRSGEGEKLDEVGAVHGQVDLVGVAFLAVDLADDLETEDTDVEVDAALDVAGNDRDMIDGVDIHGARCF